MWVALFTINVGGFTETSGVRQARNGAWPAVGVASAVANAVPTGPVKCPIITVTWAASAPSPTAEFPMALMVPIVAQPTAERLQRGPNRCDAERQEAAMGHCAGGSAKGEVRP